MPGRDDELLARLNALKPSSVSVNLTTKASVDVGVSQPQSVEDKLADRLKALRSGGHVSESFSTARAQDADVLRAQVRDEVAAESDAIRHWQQQGEDEQSLDDLLAELGPDDQWKLDPDDPKHIASLLKEAKEEPASHEEGGSERDPEEWVKVDAEQDEEGATSGRKSEGQQDEEEANDYVKRVLAELEVEKKYGAPEHDKKTRDEEEGNATGLDLPSTPSNLPQPPSASEPPSYEDSELEARFSQLGLDLPSTPSAPPSSKPRVTASVSSAKAKSKMPTYTDEDIESWCCLCNEDGEVRCLGCDGDIYCQNCWREGHGSGPGQERGHRAVQYVRKGGGGLAAA